MQEDVRLKLTSEPIDVESPETWFHAGQSRAWLSQKRFVLVLAGAQGGKSVVGVRMLLREIQRTAGQGETNDYLIVGPNTELLKKKALPLFTKRTKGLATYRAADKCFVFTDHGARRLTGFDCEVRVFVGYAHDPDSLESATYRAIWADECGQQAFLRDSWHALQRRAAVYGARVFLTTTPYVATGWLRDLHDDALAGRRDDVEIVRFRSIENPAFPQEEFDRARAELPEWKFKMFYEGEFTRPVGAVFDAFDRKKNVVRAFAVPKDWPRYIGVDFGENNTAAVMLAADPDTRDLYVYATYHAGGRTVEEHVRAILRKAAGETALNVGGSWGEDEWRTDYLAAGLPVGRPPVKDLEVGIQRVYKQVKEGRLKVFETCEALVTEIESYSRELDDRGEPLDRIRDKAKYHRLDALRYIVAALRPSSSLECSTVSRLTPSRVEIV